MTAIRPACAWTTAGLLFTVSPAAQGPASLVLDINTSPPQFAGGSSPREFTALGGQVLFAAHTRNLGNNLWRTDGTAAGTGPVSAAVEAPYGFVQLGNVLCFVAGNAPWRTDGTAAGTIRLASAQVPSNQEQPLQVVNGRLVFAAAASGSGFELWSSDGTPAGTAMLVDIAPGSASSTPEGLTVSGGLCFFAADDGVHGRELWATDGTAGGTRLVHDIAPGTTRSIEGNNFTAVPSATGIFLAANDGSLGVELWHSDGTTAGTRLVADIAPGSTSSLYRLRGAWTGTALLLTASDGITGEELWRSDGTWAGTWRLADILPGPGSGSPQHLLWTGTTLWFSSGDNVTGRELWRSDGTMAGTSLVAELERGNQGSFPGPFAWTGSVVVFPATTTAHGTELWRSDGTAFGTWLVRDITPGTGTGVSGPLAWVNGMLLFGATDPTTGTELWRSDGTAAGTTLVCDINPTPGSANPQGLVDALGTLFFTAYEPTDGTEVWRSDGTSAGTVLVRNVVPGSYGLISTSLLPLGRTVLFSASEGLLGEEPWRTDGTAAGTRQVADVLPGAFGSSPSEWVRFGDRIAFTAAPQYFYVRSVWTTDGVTVRAASPTNLALSARSPFVVGRTLYFIQTAISTAQLWKTDGTTAQLVKAVSASGLTEYQGLLHFFGVDGSGAALWRSDGTPAGTSPVRYVAGDTPAVAGGLLYFRGQDPATGHELWRSDGTTAGTVLVKDVRPGPVSSGLHGLREWNGILYFAADDGVHGFELWRSDGTAAGTWLVHDINPGPGSSLALDVGQGAPILLALPAARTLLLAADDGVHGIELWRSDGTAAGTVLHQEIHPGIWHSRPRFATASGARIFFAAEDDSHGIELWAMAAMAHAAPLGTGCEGSGGRVPVIGSAGGAPVLGNSGFAVELGAARPNSFAALALGEPAEIPVGNGCQVNFQSLLLTVFLTTDAGGHAQVPLPIPNDASLRGLVAACQFGVSDPAGAFQSMLAFSRGLRIVVSDN